MKDQNFASDFIGVFISKNGVSIKFLSGFHSSWFRLLENWLSNIFKDTVSTKRKKPYINH